jgi:hypothetical protein
MFGQPIFDSAHIVSFVADLLSAPASTREMEKVKSGTTAPMMMTVSAAVTSQPGDSETSELLKILVWLTSSATQCAPVRVIDWEAFRAFVHEEIVQCL